MIGRREKFCSMRTWGSAIAMHMIEDIGRSVALLSVTLRQMLLHPPEARGRFEQIDEVDIRSLSVVIVTAIFTGMACALQTYSGVEHHGADYFFFDDNGKVNADLLVLGKGEEHADNPHVKGGVNYFLFKNLFLSAVGDNHMNSDVRTGYDCMGLRFAFEDYNQLLGTGRGF
jgi:hypothetical protein